MNNIELVIFDMDGLMFDTETIAYRTWKEVVNKYGYPFDFTFFSTMIGSNLTRIKELCFNYYGNDFPFDEIKEERYALTSKIINEQGVPFKKGLVELLDFLKNKKIKLAIATSSGRDRAAIFLDNANILHYFDYVLCGDEITKSKPDPQIFLKTAEKLNCKPNRTIVLEDSEAGINAAYEAKMYPIMVPDLKKPSEEILAKTYKCFQTLLEVKDFLENEII